MKTILLLGGSAQQVIAITKSKELGYRTVLCDYLLDNPGKDVADSFYLVSTTDKDAVLEVARKECVDGIVAYASDPAALTAAYVAEKMGLSGQPYNSIEILTNKGKFRKFLKEHGFFVPRFESFLSFDQFVGGLSHFSFPVLIKPVDSSGSKGVKLLDELDKLQDSSLLKKVYDDAMAFSRVKQVIVEEFVNKKGFQIAGDGFTIDGNLVFRCFGDDHFDDKNPNPFVPIAASFPTVLPESIQQKVHDEIQRLFRLLELRTGAYNFDILIDEQDRVFLMDIGPRNGGNYIPQVIEQLTGVDLVAATIEAAIGNIPDLNPNYKLGYYCYYSIHSKVSGKLNRITIFEDIRTKLFGQFMNISVGSKVKALQGSSDTLGIILIAFSSSLEMLHWLNLFSMGQGISVEVESNSKD